MGSFVVTAIVVSLTAGFSFLNERFLRLQHTIGLMVIAVAFTIVLALLNALGITGAFEAEKALVVRVALDETLLNGVLSFMLFAGSINVSARMLGAEKWVILSLAFGATLIATVLIGVSIWWILGLLGVSLGLMYALVFGALISPTDPIAALAILGKVGLPPRLEAIITGESLFNDGVGVVLFTIALTVALGTAQPTASDAMILFFREVLGGIALGSAAGWLLHKMLSYTEDYGSQVLSSLAVVMLGYSIAEWVEISGPIAMVVTGLLVGNITLQRLEDQEIASFKTFWKAVDEVLNSILFVLIGLNLAVVSPADPVILLAMIAIVVCLVMRWVSVTIPIHTLAAVGKLKARTLGLTNLLTWGGLRGGLAVAMALSLPNGAEKDIILQMTYGVVAFSIIVQGLTVSRLFSRDQLAALLKSAR